MAWNIGNGTRRKASSRQAIRKGCPNTGIRKGDVVLYLGTSTGTTASQHLRHHRKGRHALWHRSCSKSPKAVRFALRAPSEYDCAARNASHPEAYADKVCIADVLYQDVAQRNQAEIFLKNARLFLKKGGYALLR